MSTYSYTATMVIAPTQASGSDGLSARLGQLGGLASAVGVSLPDGSGASSFKLYVEALKSYDVAAVLARDPVVMQHLFAREWDGAAKQWRTPQGGLRDAINAAKDVLGIPNLPWQTPNAERLQTLLDTRLAVDVNPRSPVVVIHFDDADPAFAKLLLQKVDVATDGLLRQRALLRTNDYIGYLTAKLPTVTMIEQRLAITQTLGEQERVKMAASSTRPFAADVFSGPSASPRPTSPKPYKILLLSVLAGLGLGAGVVILRARRWRQAPVTD